MCSLHVVIAAVLNASPRSRVDGEVKATQHTLNEVLRTKSVVFFSQLCFV